MTNTSTPWTQLGDIKKLKIGGVEFNESDITHLASTGAFKESRAGWGKQKPISFGMFFIEDNMEALLEATAATDLGYGRNTASFAMEGPLPTDPTVKGWVWYHTAWMKDLDVPEFDTDSDDPLMMDVELQPTGRSNFSTVTT